MNKRKYKNALSTFQLARLAGAPPLTLEDNDENRHRRTSISSARLL